MKTLIDETYLLRYVLQDEKEMFEVASALIAGAKHTPTPSTLRAPPSRCATCTACRARRSPT